MNWQETSFFDTVTGLAVADMSGTNKIATPWRKVGVAGPVSFSVQWPANVIGAFSVECTNDDNPIPTTSGDAFDLTTLLPTVKQPDDGAASGVVLFIANAPEENMRLCYLRTSGGAGVLPTVKMASGSYRK